MSITNLKIINVLPVVERALRSKFGEDIEDSLQKALELAIIREPEHLKGFLIKFATVFQYETLRADFTRSNAEENLAQLGGDIHSDQDRLDKLSEIKNPPIGSKDPNRGQGVKKPRTLRCKNNHERTTTNTSYACDGTVRCLDCLKARRKKKL